MNKRITSLLLCFVMVFTMFATAVTVGAASAENTLMITPDKTTAQPGDVITYTCSIGPIQNLRSTSVKIVVPEGLTYVANSGTVAAGLTTALGAAEAKFTEASKKFSFYGTGSYSSAADTVLFTFKCTVNAGAVGTFTIGSDPASQVFGDNTYNNIAVSYNSEASTVTVAAPVPHSHGSWIYTANGATLTAQCGASGCTTTPYSESVTLVAPAKTVYDDGKAAAATIQDSKTAVGGATLPAIQYEGTNGTTYAKSTTAPTDAGSYKASVTVDTNKAAVVAYTIAKAEGPAAPVLNVTKPSTQGGANGKITGLNSAQVYEYKLSTATGYTAVAANSTEITGLTAGTYLVRVKETANYEAGAAATVSVSDGAAAEVNGISVNSSAHKTTFKVGDTLDVTNLTILVDMSYGDDPTVNVTSGMVTGFDSTAVVASQTLTITYQGKTTTYVVSIVRADGPAAPTGLSSIAPTSENGTDGKITGLDSTLVYEYKLSTAGDYTPVAANSTEITGLAAGTYHVRVKQTATNEAGEYATVAVNAFAKTYTITFDANGGTASAGTAVTDTNGKLNALPTAARPGYNFLGWYTADGAKVTTATVFTADATVTASWQKIDIDSVPPQPSVTPPTQPETKINFFDVETSDYFYDAVKWAVENGVTYGITPTLFGSDDVCTRANAVTFLWRAAGSPAPKTTVNPFTDVKTTDYYYNAVLWAVENGITFGMSKTVFGVNNACSRGDIVCFIYRMIGSPEVQLTDSFTDVKSSDYFAKAAQWAVENGITFGTTKTTFSPAKDCSRAEIVTFLYRHFGK